MARTTVITTDEQLEDLRECKSQLHIEMSYVLLKLYEAWRKGEITHSSLPDGTQVNGPLTKRRRRSP